VYPVRPFAFVFLKSPVVIIRQKMTGINLGMVIALFSRACATIYPPALSFVGKDRSTAGAQHLIPV
jgi:hypothetical protein